MDLRMSIILFLFICFATGKKNREGREKPPKDRNHSNHRDDGLCELEISCKGEATSGLALPVKLPIRGPRGPMGPAGEKGTRGEDGLPGMPGKPGISPPIPKRVAFFAGLSDNIGPVDENTDIIFDRVVTNIGNSYDSETGRFTADVNGTFQFNVVISAQGRQKAAVMLLKNGVMIATIWAESIPYWASASNTAIVNMIPGDQVWMVLLSRASYLHGYMYSTFCGHLLFMN